MLEPAPTCSKRGPRPARHAGLFEGAFHPCTDLPDAMRVLLEALALREQTSLEPESGKVAR